LLQYFRINDPYRFIGLLVILVLLYLPFFIDLPGVTLYELKSMLVGQKVSSGFPLYTQVIDSSGPLASWIYASADTIFGNSVLGRRIFSFFILFAVTAMLGIIFIDKKVFPESSFIPPLIFGILCGFSFDNFSLSADLFGIMFLLLALNSLFREIESREQNFDRVLKTGVFIGIATLFNFSFIVYVVAALIILVLFTRTSGRKIILMITGFLLPHLLLAAIYNYNGDFEPLWRFYYAPNLGFDKTTYVGTGVILILLSIPLGFFIASLVVLNSESRFTKYQSQVLQAMFFWTVFSILQAYYSDDFRPQSFLTTAIGLSFFIAHFFSIIIRRRFAELSFWIFLAGVVTFGYLTRYEVVRPHAYDALVTKDNPAPERGTKIVVLGSDVAAYRGNRMATPFLNWQLSKEIFDNPDYYENVIWVRNGFTNDAPDVVVDPQNRLAPFLDRIPELRKKYQRTATGYVSVTKN
jgi:hypothetical protein